MLLRFWGVLPLCTKIYVYQSVIAFLLIYSSMFLGERFCYFLHALWAHFCFYADTYMRFRLFVLVRSRTGESVRLCLCALVNLGVFVFSFFFSLHFCECLPLYSWASDLLKNPCVCASQHLCFRTYVHLTFTGVLFCASKLLCIFICFSPFVSTSNLFYYCAFTF